MPILSVKDLQIDFRTDEGLVRAVDGISFELEEGQTLGLVGESGSGKSVTAKSIMQLNPSNCVIDNASQVNFYTEEKAALNTLQVKSKQDLKRIRGGEISMIFQEPMASFAPAMTIGSQMVEAIRIHNPVSKQEARATAIHLLSRVGIADAAERFKQYVFELSGGMRQRAMIAMALSTQPRLLIADEPTTALDVTIQAQVLELMKELQAEFGMAMIFISHDLGVVRQVADVVAVMYLGKIVEFGDVGDVIDNPQHPYTQGLLASLPSLKDFDAPLRPVPGDIPSPLERPNGCVFYTRCEQFISDKCDTIIPKPIDISSSHQASCLLVDPKFLKETVGEHE